MGLELGFGVQAEVRVVVEVMVGVWVGIEPEVKVEIGTVGVVIYFLHIFT